MSDTKPTMKRREFIEACARTLPAWWGVLTFASVADVLADDDSEYDPTKHNYAMGVDVDKCIGCGRCVVACKKENKVPSEPHFFRTWIERYVIPIEGEAVVDSPNGGMDGFERKGEEEQDILRSFFVPKLCNHCAEPPCVQVCPVGATFASRDGVVLVDDSYCVGCRYCIQACPYGARYLHPETHIADKCTFCYHRITEEMLPACVEVCPTQARIFGEDRRVSSPLTRFLRFNDVTVLKGWLNTQPKVYYAGAGHEVR